MRSPVVVLLLIVGLLLTACGPAIVPAAAPETDTGEVFLVALPRIVITFDEQGKPGIEGVAVEDIARTLGMELSLEQYRIDPFYPTWMSAANIQHVELRQTGDGVAVLVNGDLMPSLSFQNGTLERVGDLAPLLGPGVNVAAVQDLVTKFAPLVKRLGLSLVAKFPLRAGAEPVPFADLNVALTSSLKPSDEPASAVVKFEIRYDEQGVPSILGISARELTALVGNMPLALDAGYLRLLQANNVQHFQMRTKADGIHLFINGTPLPSLVWDGATLDNAVEVYAQMNAAAPKEVLDLVKMLVPMVGKADVSVMIHFPAAPGAEVIPAKMQ